MKLAFLGTPEVAAATLRALAEAGHEICVVVTRPPARRGRGPDASPSPVELAARDLGSPVVHAPGGALGRGAALGVVVAYGRIIRPEVLAELPMVNTHFSLLPRWRGAAPVERAILAGDPETGVCLMQLEEGLDTGPVYARAAVVIGAEETAAELRARLSQLGNRLLLDMLEGGLPVPVAQEGEVTYAAKVGPEELRLDFSQPAVTCARVVRAGRAWTTWKGKRLLVHRARALANVGGLSPGEIRGHIVGTGQGAVELVLVQPEAKGPMSGADWARGARPGPGERLGS